jgi:hypothetical protein
MSRLSIGFWFSAAVAIIAAALANPCVEFASNSGWFGHGVFTDRSNIDVIPTLVVGLALPALLFLRRIVELLFPGSAGRVQTWLRLASRVLHTRSVPSFVPAAFGMQLLVLFSMESIEQLVVRGHLLGGVLFLGGPVAVSLLVHAVFCITVAFALARTLEKLEGTAVRVARLITNGLLSARGIPPIVLRWDLTTSLRTSPLRCSTAERAPPSFAH